VSAFVIVIAAASAIATVASTAATASATAVRRGKATTKSPSPLGWRSNRHGAFPNADPPAVLSPPQDLSVFRRRCPQDRLPGCEAVAALRLRARQDRTESDHGGFRQEAAGAGAGHQTRPLSRVIALRDPLADDSAQTTEHRRASSSGRAR